MEIHFIGHLLAESQTTQSSGDGNLPGLLLGLAAIVSALGGCATTVLALRKTRDEEHEKCLERLAAARVESEKFAEELHELRMRGTADGT
jgi:hypothetical protein